MIYQHPSIESLRRELSRNSQLRRMCGFKEDKIPSPWAYSEKLVNLCYELLPDFGKYLALDSKAINSHARKKSKNIKEDGRRDLDANFGAKSYKGKHEDGSLWEKTIYWFGFKLHLLVDADYELPVAYKEMAYAGFEKKRGTLKYRCPAEHYGLGCKGKKQCPVKGSIRVAIDENRRYFLPLPRSSYRFESYYKKRVAVERVNSTLSGALKKCGFVVLWHYVLCWLWLWAG